MLCSSERGRAEREGFLSAGKGSPAGRVGVGRGGSGGVDSFCPIDWPGTTCHPNLVRLGMYRRVLNCPPPGNMNLNSVKEQNKLKPVLRKARVSVGNQSLLPPPPSLYPRILEAARCSHLTDAGFTLLARVRQTF